VVAFEFCLGQLGDVNEAHSESRYSSSLKLLLYLLCKKVARYTISDARGTLPL
jgi:hypothetical protein